MKPVGAGGARAANRLAGESSPYLLLHQHNPVDWHPWDERALELARASDRPIFLSVGYSTCYWCHVMERESFSDPAIAERMNRDFVCIKVDREERPDLDELYMTATQVLAEQGGWPNSVFLTPRLEPFFAGTYFPPEDRYGRPGFPTVLASLASAWRERRADVEEQAREVAAAMRRHLEGLAEPSAEPPGADAAERALAGLRQRFDPTWGGFGGAPKFPTPANLFLLLELAPERFEAATMLTATLEQMARGGLYDQLGGGFHRYATDREWRVPHFEKMLYDNALLLEVYARDFARSGASERARVVRETVGFLERELSAPEGGFWSAIDAETDGHEGAFYVWRRAELDEALGAEDAAFLSPLYGFDGAPFFEGDRYVLHLPRPIEQAARERRLAVAELWAEIEPLRDRLFVARAARPRPATDDKVLADWNGLTIAALATAGRLLGEAAWVERAARAADFVLGALRPAGSPLLHSWRGGVAKVPAYLADYAGMIRGLLALHRASGEARHLAAALDLAAEQRRRLAAPEGGFFNAEAAPDLLARSRDLFDGAVPGANALAALNGVELAERTGDCRHADEAGRALGAFAGAMARAPEGARTLALAARRLAGLGARISSEDRSMSESSLAAAALRVVSGTVDVRPPRPDGKRPFVLSLEVATGWHLSAPALGEGAGGFELTGDDADLFQVSYPTARLWRASASAPESLAYTGKIELMGAFVATGPRPRLTVRYQACDDRRCLTPVEREFPLA